MSKLQENIAKLREYLNTDVHINAKIKVLSKFLLLSPLKEKVIMYVYNSLPNKTTFTNEQIKALFLKATTNLVLGTTLCSDAYSSQVVLLNAYEVASFGNILVQALKLPVLPRSIIDIAEDRVDTQETVTPKETLGELKARRMREAKARKAAERKQLEPSQSPVEMVDKVATVAPVSSAVVESGITGDVTIDLPEVPANLPVKKLVSNKLDSEKLARAAELNGLKIK